VSHDDFPAWRVCLQIMPEKEVESYHINPFDLTKITMEHMRHQVHREASDPQASHKVSEAHAGHDRHAGHPSQCWTSLDQKTTGIDGAVSGTGCIAPPANDATSPWRVRRFAYGSLSRLLNASNPESNTLVSGGTSTRVNTTNAYDADSNLISKTDARGVTINYNPPDSPIDSPSDKKDLHDGQSACPHGRSRLDAPKLEKPQ
jgi:YD repeat-containing protein